ncbi:hypothetical protein B4U79_14275, partial [Dinothrombium tinctorium]
MARRKLFPGKIKLFECNSQVDWAIHESEKIKDLLLLIIRVANMPKKRYEGCELSKNIK